MQGTVTHIPRRNTKSSPVVIPCPILEIPSQRLGRKAQLERRALEDHKLRLEENVSIDGEANASV